MEKTSDRRAAETFLLSRPPQSVAHSKHLVPETPRDRQIHKGLVILLSSRQRSSSVETMLTSLLPLEMKAN